MFICSAVFLIAPASADAQRLANANKLIDGLGGEKDRWSATVGAPLCPAVESAEKVGWPFVPRGKGRLADRRVRAPARGLLDCCRSARISAAILASGSRKGMVGYAGPFAGEFRQHFEKLWLNTEEQMWNAALSLLARASCRCRVARF